ncbi:MAG TPA: hypothetical protein VGI34_02250, partial [Candidatus Acidoferrales bacterium]
EIQFGIQIMPEGKRRSLIAKAFEIAIRDGIGQRVAPFDTIAAQHSAALMASRHKMGRPVELRDTMIAGIAQACHASLATRNVSHFEDLSIPVVNPWEDETWSK